MRIAHFGTFDVENYGDLLFPLVLERRWVGRGHQLTHVSPVGGGPVWGDCVETISFREAMDREFDGFVIGGGHLIHGRPSDVPAYRDAEDRGLLAYADLWLGATIRACELGIPIVWNAPGIPGPFESETAELVRWAAEQADYLALRDPTSCAFLERTGFGGAVSVVIDTAVEVALLWSPGELDAAWRNAFVSRGHGTPARALAVHFNTRFLQAGVADTAARLDALCRKWDVMPILLALGPCHGDSSLQREIAGAMTTPSCLIDSIGSLREVAACIRGSELYLGSSLHGGVTARSFDRPAILVARETPGGHAKHSSFLAAHDRLVDSAAGRGSAHVASWDEAWTGADAFLATAATTPSQFARHAERGREADTLHWSRLADALESPPLEAKHRRQCGLERLDSLRATRWRRESSYVGILLDQAREAATHRESAQKNAQRFRQLERAHRDLKKSLRAERERSRGLGSATGGGGER